MSTKHSSDDPRFDALKNEAARQRWQLFHRAIAHAKQSNYQALEETDGSGRRDSKTDDPQTETTGRESRLSIAR